MIPFYIRNMRNEADEVGNTGTIKPKFPFLLQFWHRFEVYLFIFYSMYSSPLREKCGKICFSRECQNKNQRHMTGKALF